MTISIKAKGDIEKAIRLLKKKKYSLKALQMKAGSAGITRSQA